MAHDFSDECLTARHKIIKTSLAGVVSWCGKVGRFSSDSVTFRSRRPASFPRLIHQSSAINRIIHLVSSSKEAADADWLMMRCCHGVAMAFDRRLLLAFVAFTYSRAAVPLELHTFKLLNVIRWLDSKIWGTIPCTLPYVQ